MLGRTSKNKELWSSKQKLFLREDFREKNTLSFGHCANYLPPARSLGNFFTFEKSVKINLGRGGVPIRAITERVFFSLGSIP